MLYFQWDKEREKHAATLSKSNLYRVIKLAFIKPDSQHKNIDVSYFSTYIR